MVKWKPTSIGTSTSSCQGDSKDSISSELLLDPSILSLGAVKFTHHLVVNLFLFGDIHSLECGADDAIDILNCLQTPFSKESLLV